MFIRTKYSGYNRHGEQVAAGLFLILMQPKTDSIRFPHWSDTCADCGQLPHVHKTPLTPDAQAAYDKLHRAWLYLFTSRVNARPADVEDIKNACELMMEAQRQVTGCRYYRPSTVSYPIRAIVRHVSMHQLGHWMMGAARVHRERIGLSGAYGADGLPCSVSDEVYAHGLELPEELREAWSKGGGWNSTGSEAPAMRKWALEHLAELRG